MKIKILFHGILVISLFIINACATTTLKSVWIDPAYHEGPLKNVFIIGVFYNAEEKLFFEEELAKQMASKSIYSVPSYTIYEEKYLDKEMIRKVVDELKIDSVLIARLVIVDNIGTYYEPHVSSSGGFYNYYVECCQIPVSSGRNILIETKIFNTKYDKLIWSAVSDSILDGSFENITRSSVIPAILKDLQDRKLIK